MLKNLDSNANPQLSNYCNRCTCNIDEANVKQQWISVRKGQLQWQRIVEVNYDLTWKRERIEIRLNSNNFGRNTQTGTHAAAWNGISWSRCWSNTSGISSLSMVPLLAAPPHQFIRSHRYPGTAKHSIVLGGEYIRWRIVHRTIHRTVRYRRKVR